VYNIAHTKTMHTG